MLRQLMSALVLVGAISTGFLANLSIPSIYSIVDFGAVGGGDTTKAGSNAAAINATIAAATSGTPGTVYFPPTKSGYVVAGGIVNVNNPNVVLQGTSSMAANWGLCSTLIAQGTGHTINIGQGGCIVQGLAFQSNDELQKGNDAYIQIGDGASQVYIRDCYFDSPNIGISMNMTWPNGGEYWVTDVLMGGNFRTAGIVANAGNSAVQLHHVLMYHTDPFSGDSFNQPAYGICVPCAGELMMTNCDIDNCGSCLALVPGLNGAINQNVSAIKITGCYFDNGNGPGCVYVCPTGNGFIQNPHFDACWASTVNNNGGKWNTNGWTFDGTKSTPPPGVKPISNVILNACNAQNFLMHDGFYLIGCQGVSVTGCSGCGCWNGLQMGGPLPTMACSGNVFGCCFGNYINTPLGSTWTGGNVNYGILIQKSPSMICFPAFNSLDGNKAGPIQILQ